MRCITGFFFLAPLLAACSCSDALPACELFPATSVVFVGTVLDGNDDGSGRFVQRTAYLVRVDESLRGLAPDQKEVFIDPGSYTSCYTHYAIGRTYLFYAGGMGNFVATTVIREGEQPKRLPPAWETKKDLKIYHAAQCSGSKPIANATEDLAWIRRAARGEASNRVYGAVYQHYESYRPKSASVPLAGAKVRLQGAGPSAEATSGPDGEYDFGGVTSGRYHLWAELPPWEGSYRQEVELRAGGCVERALRMQSHGVVRGTVRKADGAAAANVSVELVRVLRDGALAEDYSLWAETNAQGQFSIRDAPAGTFVAGVNLRSPMTATQPWRPTYFPGASVQSEAKVLELQPNQETANVHIQLPPPRPTRAVQVRVFWADGTPALGGARARAAAKTLHSRLGDGNQAKDGHIVELRLMQEYEYAVSADWYRMTPKKSLHFDSDEVTLPPGTESAVIDIRLKANRPEEAARVQR